MNSILKLKIINILLIDKGDLPSGLSKFADKQPFAESDSDDDEEYEEDKEEEDNLINFENE